MRLHSSAFPDGGQIPNRYTCEGNNVSPPLAWSDAPAATRSFALICRDPDAPGKIFHHWGAYDIAATTNYLPEGWASAARKQAVNDFGRVGYGGPCPPKGMGTHHYHFVLYALEVGALAVPAKASCAVLERALEDRAIATAELIGTFARRG